MDAVWTSVPVKIVVFFSVAIGTPERITLPGGYGCERGSSTVNPSAVAASLRAWSAEISRHRSETSILLLLVDFEGGGELHGVIGAQRVRIRQSHGLIE